MWLEALRAASLLEETLRSDVPFALRPHLTLVLTGKQGYFWAQQLSLLKLSLLSFRWLSLTWQGSPLCSPVCKLAQQHLRVLSLPLLLLCCKPLCRHGYFWGVLTSPVWEPAGGLLQHLGQKIWGRIRSSTRTVLDQTDPTQGTPSLHHLQGASSASS